MPLRRLPGPPDLERVAAVLGGPPPEPIRPGWVPDRPVGEPAEGRGVGEVTPSGARMGDGTRARPPLVALEVGDPKPRSAASGASDDEVGRLDAELRAARRPRIFTVPEQLRTGRLSVSSSAVVALLALVLALGCAFAVRVLWAERSAGVALEPAARSGGTVAVTRESSTAAASTGGPRESPGPTASAGRLVVHVVGQVKRPGLVRLASGSRVADAIAAAGGAKPTADLSLLNLARPVVDGEQVHVPRPGETPPPGASGAAAGGSGATGPGRGGGAAGLVNLNTADLAALDTLPGVGPVLAQRILDWRTEHGRFTSIEELGEVSGIGEKLYAQIRPKVTV